MNIEDRELPPHRLWQTTTAKWFFMVFGISLAYAVIRYHVAGDVPWHHFPLFILNKATSLSAVIFVACSYLIGKIIPWHDSDKALRLVIIKFCGLIGFFLAAVHAFFSLCLWSPAYYGKYFDVGGRINLQGEVAMASGVIALFFLLAPAITTLPGMPKAIGGWRWKRSQRAGYISLIFVVVHLVALGLKGWLAPSYWHGGIPPVSLVAVIAALIPLFVKRKMEHGKKALQTEIASRADTNEDKA